jgi:hypothetical protein
MRFAFLMARNPGSSIPSRRVRPDIFTREQALELAKAFARAERDKDGSET